MVARDPETSPPGFGDACSSIARGIADSRELEQILTRVASAVRVVVPADAMRIWHAEAPDDPVVLTLGPSAPRARGASDRPLRRADHSSRLWQEAGRFSVVVGDAAQPRSAPCWSISVACEPCSGRTRFQIWVDMVVWQVW
jgi:hypothetical protein